MAIATRAIEFTTPGVFIRGTLEDGESPAWSRTDVASICDTASSAFKCLHEFETAAFGFFEQGYGVDDLRAQFVAGADTIPGSSIEVGMDFPQNPTEGAIHPHNLTDEIPTGLVGEVDFVRRELQSLERGFEQEDNAPFYLAFMNEADRATCFESESRDCVPVDSFRYTESGKNVTVYSIGEDIDRGVSDISNNIVPSIESFVSQRISVFPQICETWQGTHVASLVGGLVHGVAKSVTQVPVAVKPGCRLKGSALDFVRGLQWIIERHRFATGPAVAVSSTKLPVMRDDTVAVHVLEDLVRVMVASNITFVATSGANAQDALRFSPGRMSEVVTVGGLKVFREATTGLLATIHWDNSNFGAALDIWAPAVYITAPRSADEIGTYSGVPQAAGLVAGVAAMILERHPDATPEFVKRRLIETGSKDLIVTKIPRTTDVVLQVRLSDDAP